MDTPSTESPLTLDQAANVFTSLLQEPSAEVVESDEDKALKLVEAEAETPEAKEPETTEETPEEASQDVTVEVDGKQVKLTKEQIAEAYKNGLRQQDYTKKTMEAAAERKFATFEKEAAKKERAEYAQKVNDYAVQLKGALEQQGAQNWEDLLNSDPVEYLKQQHLYQSRQAAFQKTRQEQFQLQEIQRVEQAEFLDLFIQTQQQELLAKLPEWKDEKKATVEKNNIRSYLLDAGFEANEVSNVTDHRSVILARKAMLYDNLMKRAKTAITKVAPLPAKVERSGAAETRNSDAKANALRKLSKSGSINDAAAYFSSII